MELLYSGGSFVATRYAHTVQWTPGMCFAFPAGFSNSNVVGHSTLSIESLKEPWQWTYNSISATNIPLSSIRVTPFLKIQEEIA